MATKSLIYLRSAELMNSLSYTKLVLQPLLQNKLRVFCYPSYLTFTRSCWRTHKGSWRPYNILCQQPEYALPNVWQVEIHATSGVGTDLFLNSISTHEESCLCNSLPSLDRYFAGFTCSIECHLLPTPDLSLPTQGADPGFFLGGGALVSCSTSTS